VSPSGVSSPLGFRPTALSLLLRGGPGLRLRAFPAPLLIFLRQRTSRRRFQHFVSRQEAICLRMAGKCRSRRIGSSEAARRSAPSADRQGGNGGQGRPVHQPPRRSADQPHDAGCRGTHRLAAHHAQRIGGVGHGAAAGIMRPAGQPQTHGRGRRRACSLCQPGVGGTAAPQPRADDPGRL